MALATLAAVAPFIAPVARTVFNAGYEGYQGISRHETPKDVLRDIAKGGYEQIGREISSRFAPPKTLDENGREVKVSSKGVPVKSIPQNVIETVFDFGGKILFDKNGNQIKVKEVGGGDKAPQFHGDYKPITTRENRRVGEMMTDHAVGAALDEFEAMEESAAADNLLRTLPQQENTPGLNIVSGSPVAPRQTPGSLVEGGSPNAHSEQHQSVSVNTGTGEVKYLHDIGGPQKGHIGYQLRGGGVGSGLRGQPGSSLQFVPGVEPFNLDFLKLTERPQTGKTYISAYDQIQAPLQTGVWNPGGSGAFPAGSIYSPRGMANNLATAGKFCRGEIMGSRQQIPQYKPRSDQHVKSDMHKNGLLCASSGVAAGYPEIPAVKNAYCRGEEMVEVLRPDKSNKYRKEKIKVRAPVRKRH